jgi:hypothetical protein
MNYRAIPALALVLLAACSRAPAAADAMAPVDLDAADGDLASVNDLGSSLDLVTANPDLAEPDPFSAPFNGNFGGAAVASVSYQMNGMPFMQSAASASFWNAHGGVAPTCSSSRIGACWVGVCTAGQPETDSLVPGGAMTITGANQPITLTPTGTAYSGYDGTGKTLFSGGEMLTVNAAGVANGPPAFTATVTAPEAVTFSTPTFAPELGTLNVSRASDLAFAWMPEPDGAIVVTLGGSISGATSQSVTMICTFPSNAGSGVVPKQALKMATDSFGTFQIAVLNQVKFDVMGWHLSWAASSVALQNGAAVPQSYVNFTN